MIRKFALLATAAALVVACGGPTEDEMKAKAQAEADSVAKASQAKIEADAAAQKAIEDSLARTAAMNADTVKTEAAPAGH